MVTPLLRGEYRVQLRHRFTFQAIDPDKGDVQIILSNY